MKHRRAAVRYNGEPGVWLHDEVADCALQMLDELKLLQHRESMLVKGINLREAEVQELRLSLNEYQLAFDDLKEAQSLTEKRATKAEKAHKQWKRRRWIWAAVGVAVGVGTTVLIAFAVN